MELRQRVVDFVEEGHAHRAAAAQFRVSIKFVNDMVLLKRRTGALDAKPQGSGGGHGKLAGVAGWIAQRIKEKRCQRRRQNRPWGGAKPGQWWGLSAMARALAR
jgi:transposase